MTSVFDGMTGILADVFGAPVIWHPANGSDTVIQSIFRESPIVVDGADGQIVRIEAPSWRVARDLAPTVARGDQITIADGRSFRVMVVHNTGSPAQDAFFICELQIAAGG